MLSGSTQAIALHLDEKRTPSRQGPLPFTFQLPLADQTKLRALNTTHQKDFGLAFPEGQGPELAQKLHEELRRLNQIEQELEHSPDKLLISHYKLAIMKAFEAHLRELTHQARPK